MKRLLVLMVLAACGACATTTGDFCYDDRDCPGGRCDRNSGQCIATPPPDGADGEAEASSCDTATCEAECRSTGYSGGACLGTTCQCVGSPPDGGPDTSDVPPDGACDPAACNAECAIFGLPGTCGTSGCVCGGGPDAGDVTDVPIDDAVVPEDAPVDDASGCPPGTTLCGTTCVDTSTAAAHCGGCDRPCRSD